MKSMKKPKGLKMTFLPARYCHSSSSAASVKFPVDAGVTCYLSSCPSCNISLFIIQKTITITSTFTIGQFQHRI